MGGGTVHLIACREVLRPREVIRGPEELVFGAD